LVKQQGDPIREHHAVTSTIMNDSLIQSAVGKRPLTRVLLIDDGHGLSNRMEQALHQTPLHVESRSLPGYLMALGDLGVSDDPPHAIIGPIDSLNGDLRATASALHELAPHTRLIAVTHSAQPGQISEAIAAGFDDCLGDHATAAELSRSLGMIETADDGDAIEVAAPVAAEPPAPLSAPLSAPFALDTTLLDQLLHPRGQVLAHALPLISASTGIESLSFAETSDVDSIPEDHVVAQVSHMGQTFGHLHAPPSATGESLTEKLTEAAAWLSRWLLLHKQQQDLWFMAMRDELTQAWNRRYFQRFLRMAISRAAEDRTAVTLLIFDVDDFKQYNDRYGHKAGDDILRETVKLMKAVVRENDVVARIGGDEFAVIFWDAEAPRRANSRHPADSARVVERFRKALATHKFPKLTLEAAGSLTISGGLASYPWDAQNAEDLIARADDNAMDAKRQGKNAIAFGNTERADRPDRAEHTDRDEYTDRPEHGDRADRTE